jgi:hypothetical protein
LREIPVAPIFVRYCWNSFSKTPCSAFTEDFTARLVPVLPQVILAFAQLEPRSDDATGFRLAPANHHRPPALHPPTPASITAVSRDQRPPAPEANAPRRFAIGYFGYVAERSIDSILGDEDHYFVVWKQVRDRDRLCHQRLEPWSGREARCLVPAFGGAD